MALLLINVSTAANLAASLKDTVGSSTGASLRPATIKRSDAFKPLPLPPDPPYHSPTVLPVLRKTIQKTRMPLTIMRKPRPVFVAETQEPVEASAIPDSIGTHRVQPKTGQDTTNMPVYQHATRTSSVYSTDSMSSLDSRETTISDIVELYTDLINKVAHKGGTSDLQILQPQAYRDTVAPLLERRFSNSSAESKHARPSASLSLPKPSVSSNQVECLPHSSYKRAPTFLDFSRNLRERRAELVSPISASSSKFSGRMTLDTISEPSPITSPEIRPLILRASFEVTDAPSHGERDTAAQAFNSGLGDCFQHEPQPYEAAGPVRIPFLCETEQVIRAVRSAEIIPQPSNWNISGSKPRSHLASQYRLPLSAQQKQYQQRPNHYHREISARMTPHSSATHHTSGDETKAAVYGAGATASSLGEYGRQTGLVPSEIPPHDLHNLPDPTRLSNHGKGSSMPDGFDGARRKLCWTQTSQPHLNAAMLSLSDQYWNPIPVKTVLPYENKVRQAEKHGKGKAQNVRGRKGRPLEHHELQPRLEIPSNPAGSGHRRTSSSQSHESISSASSHSKKKSFMATLENARNSFTQSSADKRREKIKESITVLGPTQLTVENAVVSAKSF